MARRLAHCTPRIFRNIAFFHCSTSGSLCQPALAENVGHSPKENAETPAKRLF
jgi:hypothetical protein